MTDRPSRFRLGESASSAPRGGPAQGQGSTSKGGPTSPGAPPGGPKAQAPKTANPMTPLLMMLVMLMVITSPGLRQGMGSAAGGILEPLIGFSGQMLILTLLLAGLIMVTSTTLIRHLVMNWIKMAEVQQKMGAFQKAVREARKAGNYTRMQKLMKTHQPKVMAMQGEMSSNQMKPMIFTMLIALPIFMWLYTFMDGLAWEYASLPWEPFWKLQDRILFLPHWIVLYSLMSLPFGQALQRTLKLLTFGPELRKLKEAKGQG